MGQTLSNGVYLPNEGERNCYAGLASNWQILNTAVGNIAEKAPLVHTHGNITNDGKVGTTANLPLITGTGGAITAGAFGNAANTFCEGNDSRLSDARTPLSHTHTKSNVTDLLNSDFIPSANNSYDLGSSSYQWNNLYAKKVNTQSVNGINPGTLSFPDPDFSNIVDFSTTLNNLTKETATASKFSWTATVTGWMTIIWYVKNLTPPHRVSIYATLSDHDGDLRYHIFATSFATGTPDYYLCSSFPAVAGVKYWFDTSFSNTSIGTVFHAYLLPCLGNV